MHHYARIVRDLVWSTGLEAIRYCETVGLMPEPPRGPAGHQCYGPPNVDRLRFVMRARNLGITMEEIRGLLSTVVAGSQTCGEVEAMGRKHLATVRAKIRDLKAIEKVLDDTVSCCTVGQTADCALLDVLSS